MPGDAFYPDRVGLHELRICFATIAPARAEEFARRLAASLESCRPPRIGAAKLAAKA